MSDVEAPVVEPVVVPPVVEVVEPPAPGEDALGDAGKKALDAMKAERNAARAEAAAAKAALEQATKADETAAETARREATEIANKRVVRSELKAAATGRLKDVGDVFQFIDPTTFTVDANGDVDSDALNQAVTELLVRKPYLAADQNPFLGGGDGGARPPAKPTATVDEQIAAAHAKGDWRTELALQNSKLPDPPA